MTDAPGSFAPSTQRTGTLTAWAGYASRHPAITLLLLAMLARLITFGDPIVHVDEQFYFATARAMWKGAVPFVDIWDRKPIGLFLIYMPAAWFGLPLGIWVYQLLALLSLVGTALLGVSMAERAGFTRGALFAGVAYVLWPNLLEGQGGQSPIFYNLLVACAATLLIRHDAARYRTSLAAMAIIGVALQIKYSVVFEGVFFGLWCMGCRWRARRRLLPVLTYGAALAATALVPTLIVAWSYARAGHFPEFWFANFTAITLRRANPLINQYGDLLSTILILSPLVTMGVLVFAARWRAGLAMAQTFVFGWLFSSIFGVVIFGTWFLHYALPILVPAAICAAGIVDRSAEARRWAMICLMAVAIGGQVLLALKLAGRGSARQFYALAAAVDRDPGCLFVYSGPPMLYAATDRCRLTRFTFPTQLSRDREYGAIGVDQITELKRVLATRPTTIVTRPLYEGERPAVHAVMEAALRRNYTLQRVVRLGNEGISIFALKASAR